MPPEGTASLRLCVFALKIDWPAAGEGAQRKDRRKQAVAMRALWPWRHIGVAIMP
jgi:hypothetical protein